MMQNVLSDQICGKRSHQHMGKHIFISDIHLNRADAYRSGLSWFKPEMHEKRLLTFLNSLLDRTSEIESLNLLGDIFDSWVCAPNDIPPTHDEIAESSTTIIAKLQQVSEVIRVRAVPGNHDFDVHLPRYLPNLQQEARYLAQPGLFYAEHGHALVFMNTPDYDRDPGGYPLGYYLTRMASISKTSSGDPLDYVGSFLDDFAEAIFTSQTLWSSILEGMSENTGVTTITTLDGSDVSVEELKERFANLGEGRPFKEVVKAAYRAVKGLDRIADKMATAERPVILFGHTHGATLDKDTFLVKDRIYVNTGSWCRSVATYAEVEDLDDNHIQVSLVAVDNEGNEETRETETITREET